MWDVSGTVNIGLQRKYTFEGDMNPVDCGQTEGLSIMMYQPTYQHLDTSHLSHVSTLNSLSNSKTETGQQTRRL